jgi:hypothetical protein
MKKFTKTVLMAKFIRSLIIILSFIITVIALLSGCSKVFMPKVNMDNTKIIAMSGKQSVEVAEVYELVNILIALTDYGKNNTELIDTTTGYYKRVVSHFGKYKADPLVQKIAKKIPKKLFGQSNINSFSLRLTSTNYEIDKNGKLYDTKMYNLFKAPTILHTAKIADELNNFIENTKFLDFYISEKKYYDTLISEQKKYGEYENVIKWLSLNFSIPTNQSQRILTSPLMGGNHFTIPFHQQNQNGHVLMFVAPPQQKATDTLVFIKKSKIIGTFLTEVDENYVQPLCNTKFKSIIELSIINPTNWSQMGKGNYDTKISAFTEMFTHSLFVLYCYDNFPKEEFEIIKKRKEERMINYRKFVRFKEFNEKLLDLYKKKKSADKAEDLIPAITDWMKKQQL